MTAIWMLIEGDEDGNPIRLYRSEDEVLDVINERAEDETGTVEFHDLEWLLSNRDANYWRSGLDHGVRVRDAVLLRVEAKVPQPVTAKWAIPA